MFCVNCGVELVKLNQMFCHSCGKQIVTSFPTFKQQPIEIVEPPGPYSKKCLRFAIISFVLSIVANVFFSFVLPTVVYHSNWKNYVSIYIILRLIVILINVIGVMFGLLSRKSSMKARELESSNSFENVGCIFAIIGIISNAVSIGNSIVNIFLVIFLS